MKNLKKTKNKTKKKSDPLDRDLSSLLKSGNWQRVKFELRPKNKVITLRLSEALLDAIKFEAEKSGLDYQKFIRLSLERALEKAA